MNKHLYIQNKYKYIKKRGGENFEYMKKENMSKKVDKKVEDMEKENMYKKVYKKVEDMSKIDKLELIFILQKKNINCLNININELEENIKKQQFPNLYDDQDFKNSLTKLTRDEKKNIIKEVIKNLNLDENNYICKKLESYINNDNNKNNDDNDNNFLNDYWS